MKSTPKPNEWLPRTILVLMISLYLTALGATVLKEYSMYWYGNFDLGIPDQGIWLLSRFHNPYLTVRGLNLFGDHASYIHLFVAPIYWIWNDAKALILLNTFALAIGAIPIYWIAKDKFKNPWIPLIFSFSYLMLPALHYSNLDSGYHYESFVVPLVLLGYHGLTRKNYNLFYVTTFLCLLCKEEIAVTFILYGLYVAWKHDRKIGLITSVCSLAYLLIVMHFFMPYFNGQGAFYTNRITGSMGSTPTEIIKSLTNPSFMWNKFINPPNKEFLMKLFGPVGYLVILEPFAILSSGSLWLDLIQNWSYAHSIVYHYVTPIIPFIYIALIEGIGKFKILKYPLLILLIASAVYGNYYWGPDQMTLKNPNMPIERIKNFGNVSYDDAQVLSLMDMIPPNASVSATYNYISHLSHRKKAYMYPNPYRVNLYGINDGGTPPDKYTQYVLFDTRLIIDEEKKFKTNDKITNSGDYAMIGNFSYTELWKRIK